jgi:hypothetical protein
MPPEFFAAWNNTAVRGSAKNSGGMPAAGP